MRSGTVSTLATGYRRGVVGKSKGKTGMPIALYPMFLVVFIILSGAIQTIRRPGKDFLSILEYGVTTGPGIIVSLLLFGLFVFLTLYLKKRTRSDYIHDVQRDLTVSAHGTKGTQYWLVGDEIPQVYGLLRKEQYNLEAIFINSRR